MAWSPADLSPVAWYDVDSSSSTTAITDSSGNGRADLAFGAGSNSPAYVDYADIGPGVRIAGTTNPGLSTTTTSLLGGAAALDVRGAFRLANWGTANTLMSKGSNQAGAANWLFDFNVDSTGKLTARVSSGTTAPRATSSAAVGFSANTLNAVRFTWDGSTCKFYTKSTTLATAYADIADNTGWTQLGTNQTLSTTAGSQTVAFFLGQTSSSTVLADGSSVHAAWFSDSIDGTCKLAFDAALCGQTGYTDSNASLAWSIGRVTSGRKSLVVSPTANATRDLLLGGTDDWLDGSTAAVPSATSSDSCTLAAVIRPWATQAAGKIVATTRATTTAKGISIEMAGTASVRAVISDGTTTVTSASVSLTLGARALVGAIVSSDGTVRALVANRSGVTLGATSSRTGNDETGGDLRCFADQSGGNVMDTESEMPWASWSSALSTTQLDQIWQYYDGGVRATLADTTASLAGGQIAKATIAPTLDAVTASAAGKLTISGSIAATLDDATSTATGVVPYVGALAATLDATTASVTAKQVAAATTTPTLDATTGALAGGLTVSGTIAPTLADVTASAAGTLTISGSLAATLDATTAAVAVAQVAAGTLTPTLDAVTGAAAGGLAVSGTVAPTLDDLASDIPVKLTISGTLARTLADAITATDAGLTAAGSATATLGTTTGALVGEVPYSGSMIATLDPVTISAEGAVGFVGVLAATLAPVTASIVATGVLLPVAPRAAVFRESSVGLFRESTVAVHRER